MTTNLKPLLTIADLDAMPEDDGYRYEVIEGELFVSRSPGLTHQIVSDNLIVLLRIFLKSNAVGVAVSTPGLVLSEYSGVIPDVVYFSNQRRNIVSDQRLTSAPDLVVEILSPGTENTKRDRVAKRALYAKHGVSEYWIVDSESRAVEIYRLEGRSLEPYVTFVHGETLSTAVLPGFSCAVSEIFEDPWE